MSVVPLRVRSAPAPARALPAAPARPTAEGFGLRLLRDGIVAPDRMVQALTLGARRRARIGDILLSNGLIAEDVLMAAMADYWGMPAAPLDDGTPDPRLVDRIGARDCLREGVLPLWQVGDATLVALANPEDAAPQRARLERLFGRVVLCLAPRARIEAAVAAVRGRALVRAAETRVAAEDSCRDWGGPKTTAILLAAGALALLALALAPVPVLLALTFWSVVTLALSTGLKVAAAIAAARAPLPEPDAPAVARQPVVSVIVALYREADIALRLVRRLDRIDYPRECLDILLAVEAEDHLTREALARATLPPWMRIVVVPDGQLKTKPRALNYALDHCRGTIIGVYDAEDAPEAGQIARVVERFHQRGPDVACLQGVLDFYNPQTNWLSRCFTIEYATWFRVILPGLARLGLPVPLGGTTLFFRRDALESLGGWDAHNVTEDADLGMRLARHGYRTDLIETVTREEANCRAIPWIKQRSRWIKGYMMTWAVHMRNPARLWRELGPRQFAGFQILFLGSLSQVLLMPLLWSFWALSLGLPHPLAGALPAGFMLAMVALFLLSEAANVSLGIIGLGKTRHRLSRLWVPTLHLYFPLGALAAYKALWEVITRPFYWDKTSHGVFDPPEA